MLNDHPINVPNLCTPQPDLLACGMPSEQDLQDAAKKGIKTIINLCPQEETPPSESDLVEQLGMNYVNIPIRGPQDLTKEAAQQLASLMDDCANHPLLVHCRPGRNAPDTGGHGSSSFCRRSISSCLSANTPKPGIWAGHGRKT